MIANISLLGWRVNGLRCPDHDINLRVGKSGIPYPVTLIQMPNGTGKTTTLNLLRAVLSGAAEHWGKTDVLAMQRSKDPVDEGNFVVSLSVNSKPVTFKLSLNFRNGSVKYETTIGSGIRNGFHPPRNISRFLTPQFVDLFVFDGELANNLTDNRKTRARQAIDSLFQLTLFNDIQEKLDLNWQKHVTDVKIKGEHALTKRRNKLDKLSEKLGLLQDENKRLKKQLILLEQELHRSNEAYNAALIKDKNIGNQLENINLSLIEANNKLKTLVNSTVLDMRQPHRLSTDFGLSLQLLKSSLDKLKLPSSTSREFFEELAAEDECICGREMSDDIREAVKKRAKLYLADEEVGILNSIKSDIAKFCGDDPNSYFSEHENQISEINNSLRHRDELNTEYNSLVEQRLSQGDTDLEVKKAELDKINATVRDKQQRLNILESKAEGNENDDTECIKALEKKVAEAKQDVAEASSTVKLKDCTEITKKILSEAQSIARKQLRKLIIQETNDRIKSLLSSDPVLISDIQDSLILEGQSGASVGQTLSVGYAFLATLFDRSDYSLPFVVDSPAGPLDLKVRPQVAKLIPKLCKQFVAFTISSERDKFIEPLAIAASQKIQYTTVFRNTPKTASIKLSNSAQKTRNGVIVNDKDFFINFDLEDEEDL